jgi:Uma2 family endonuclease
VKAVPYDPTPVLERPDLVIEIPSPDDTLTDAPAKCAEYLSAGIPGIWVADFARLYYSYGPGWSLPGQPAGLGK